MARLWMRRTRDAGVTHSTLSGILAHELDVGLNFRSEMKACPMACLLFP